MKCENCLYWRRRVVPVVGRVGQVQGQCLFQTAAKREMLIESNRLGGLDMFTTGRNGYCEHWISSADA